VNVAGGISVAVVSTPGAAAWSGAFIGPTGKVTLTTNSQRITGSGSASLATASATAELWFGLCYQAAGGAVTLMAGPEQYQRAFVTTTLSPYSTASSAVPGAGTYTVGFCGQDVDVSSTPIANNDWVNAWFAVTN